MKSRCLIFIAVMALLLDAGIHAQEQEVLDSVMVFGTVINQISRQTEPYCLVRFLHGKELCREVLTDENGDFAAMGIPAGEYTLEVDVKGLSLHRENLTLTSNVTLSVSVITDSVKLVNLPEVDVNDTRPKHELVEQELLIEKTDDVRLRCFNYRWWIHAAWGGRWDPPSFGAPASQMAP